MGMETEPMNVEKPKGNDAIKTILTIGVLLILSGCAAYTPGTHSPAHTTSATPPISTEANPMLNIPQQSGGIERYGNDQATGPVIDGVHQGIPAGPPKVTCHGAIVGGVCTGPQF